MAARKKRMIILVSAGIAIAAVGLLASIMQARAEVLKGRVSSNMVKMETVPIPDLENHVLGFGIRDGLAFFDSGEVTAFKNFTTWDLVMGKGGPVQSYHLFTFIDGSTIITANHQENLVDAEGKFAWDIIFTGKIVKGTGRFEGIKGSYSGTGKQLKPQKDELTGKTIYDCTLTYTVPSK